MNNSHYLPKGFYSAKLRNPYKNLAVYIYVTRNVRQIPSTKRLYTLPNSGVAVSLFIIIMK